MTEQRKLAAVMFTDIAGYTALMSRDEQKALQILDKNRTLQKDLAQKHNGEFLKEMGDGTLLCFQSALDAVQCAMAIQESVKDDPALNLRIGIHLGDIVFREGDVFGDGVNVASRIEHLTDTGGICISEDIHKLVRNQPAIKTIYIGEKRFKNVDHPIKIHTISESLEKPDPNIKHTESYKKSIIVLPFEDISPNKDNEYFSDGLTEEVITDLSYIHDLLVISRNSAMSFKGTKKKTNEIVKEVNVQYVLEGSVRKVGNNLRITAQLIDAVKDVHLWAERYDGTLDDIFKIQGSVSRSITDALKIKLAYDERKMIENRQIDNIQAYELYLRAKYEFWKYTQESFKKALDYLNRGIDIVGDNVLLYSGMGTVYYGLEDLGITDEPYHTKMIEIADKIFTMEPDSSHAHRILGLAYYRTHFKKTNEHFKKAIITDPNNPELLEWYSAMLAFLWGKPSAAAPLVERLLEIDPITPFNQGVLSLYHLARGRIDEAINSAQKYLQLEPESLMAKATYAEWLGYTQDYHQAIHLFDEMIEDEPDHIFAFIYEFMKYAFLGEKEKALQLVLEDNRIQVAWNDCQLSRTIAEGFALLNEREKALDWLENAIDRGFINYPFFDGIDPHLENIRSEERFKELMKRVKKEWENFEV